MRNWISRVLDLRSFHVRAMLTVVFALVTSVSVAMAETTSSPSGYATLDSATGGAGSISVGAPGGRGFFDLGPIRIAKPNNITIGGVRFSFANDYETYFENQACNVLGLTKGKFAALVMVVSGLIAIVSAATGAYRIALATLVVGIGSSILETVVEYFFGNLCPFLTIHLGS